MPLSLGQEQIWLHAQTAPDLPLYNETVTLHFRGELDCELLRAAFQEIVERHEILRSRIEVVNGDPRRLIRAETSIPFDSIDLSAWSEGAGEREALRLAAESAALPFSLEEGPLLRVLTAKLDRDDFYIFLILHHLIFDGVSIRHVLLKELTEIYGALRQGAPSNLSPVALQFADYVQWERQRDEGTALRSLGYWREQLAGLPNLTMPADRPRNGKTGLHGGVRSFRFDRALTAALKALSRSEKSTLFHALLAGFSIALTRCSGEEDLRLGIMADARTRPEFADILGYFLNTLVLRVDCSPNSSGEPSFLDLLARVRETVLSMLGHAEVPFQRLVRELDLSRDTEGAALQVMFVMQPPLPDLPPEWDLDTFAVSNGTAKFELHVELEEKEDEVIGRITYRMDLFEASTVERLIEYWRRLMEEAVAAPERSIQMLPLLKEEERLWLRRLNATDSEYPQLTLPALFAQQADLTPERRAAGFSGGALTYGELEKQSTSFASYLRTQGVGPGVVVGVLLDRSPDLLVVLLGVMKAGAAYLPLDPGYPTARLEAMLRVSEAALVVTRSSLRGRLSHARAVEIDRYPRRGKEDAMSVPAGPRLSEAAYILFTSGSTGEPKGVEIPHRALTNLLWSMKQRPGLNESDVLLAVTSIGFDIAALELFLPLLCGARVEVATVEEARDPVLLQARLRRSRATVMQATPTAWRMLIESGWEGSASLKALCGGEELTGALAVELLPRVGSLWNMYGPTETTIWSSCCRIERAGAPIPLGTPIANTQFHVLDRYRSPLPAGCPGELAIGGDGLATGYRNNAEETARRFVFPDGPDAPRRVYLTGDRVVRRPDGSLLFLGRQDGQVKLRGVRIELGEIEQAIRRFEAVAESVVLKVRRSDGEEELAAWVAPRSRASLSVPELRRHLERLLPAPLRPSTIQVVDALPLTANGKLDRKRLAAEAATRKDVEAEPLRQAPKPGTEQTVAAIWCELLGVERVGREDNFFELGGHSLLAARLMARLSEIFGRRLSLATLAQAPTVAELAGMLSATADSGPLLSIHTMTPLRRGILPEREKSPRKHMLWIGSAPWLRAFADILGPDQSMSIFDFDAEILRSLAPWYRMEDIARQLLAQVREIQPKGPYLLGGFCLAALPAYEMAQQLQASGEEVALLVIGDVPAPGRRQKSLPWRLEYRIRKELPWLRKVGRTPPWKMGSLLRWRWQEFQNARTRRKWRQFGHKGIAATEPAETLQQALFMAETRYAVKPYAGSVCLMESEGNRDEPAWHTADTWRGLVEDPEIFVYPGDHLDFEKEPCLSLGAGYLRDAIDRAIGENRFDATTESEGMSVMAARGSSPERVSA